MKNILRLSLLSLVTLVTTTFAAGHQECPGITKASHPQGLSYPAFNCFTDNNWLGTNYGGDKREQNFVRVKKNNGAWKDSVGNLETGDKVRVAVFIHNSGKEGGANTGAADAEIFMKWSNPNDIYADIWGSNVGPSRIDDYVDDNTVVNLGPAHSLRPLAGYQRNRNGVANAMAKIKTFSAGDVFWQLEWNNYPACYSFANVYEVEFVVEGPPPAPTCDKAEFNKTTIDPGETTRFSWMTSNVGGVELECSGAGVTLNNNNLSADGNKNVTVPTSANDGDTLICRVTGAGLPTCRAELPVEDVQRCGDGVVEGPEQCDNGDDNGTPDNTCSNTCEIIEVPAIAILKWAANQDDQDKVITGDNDANDTQQVNSEDPNDVSVFRIRVENTGNVGLKNVRVEDVKAPECALSAAQVADIMTTGSTSKTTISNVKVTGITSANNILDEGEFFRYDCTQDGVRDSYTNRARTVGEPVNGDPNVNAADTTEVVVCNLIDDGSGTPVCPAVVNPKPSIDIVKTDKNTADFDEVVGDDSQLLIQGNTAVFEITVTNNGNEALKDVVVTDSESPECELTAAETKRLYPGTLFDPGETFTYECTKENAQPGDFDGSNGQGSVDGKNDARVDAIGDDSGTPVNAEDPSEVKFFPICTPQQGTLVINKDDSTPVQPDQDGDDTQIVGDGGTAEFTITVTNTGTTAVSNVTVVDTLSPSCAKDETEFMALLGAVGNNDAVFDGGEAVTYTCTQASVTADFTNSATVTGIVNQHDCAVTDTDTTEVVFNTDAGFCGDGIVQAPEKCDNGALNGTTGNACSANCTTGGGTSDTNPSVGTCSNDPVTGASQCTRVKPVEDVSDPLWQSYRACKAGETLPRHTGTGLLLAELCALDWAEDQNLLLCGPKIAGATDPFGDVSGVSCEEECIGAGCDGGGCTGLGCYPDTCVEAPVDCPGCFKTNTGITKTAITETVSSGDKAKFQIDVTLDSFERSNYQVLQGHIRVYDMLIPAESSNMWHLGDSVIDGDDTATWTWCGDPDNAAICGETEDYFRADLSTLKVAGGQTALNSINSNASTTLEVHYDMDTRVASTFDASQIENVAYAVVYYEYEVIDAGNPYGLALGSTHTHVAGVGKKACDDTTVQTYISSNASVGSTATVNIIRPFIKARAGNAGYFGDGNEDKAFGDQASDNWDAGTLDPTDFNYGLTLTDDTNVYTGAEQGDAGTFSDFQEQQDAFYDNLDAAADENVTFGATAAKRVGDSNVYQINGNLDVSDLSSLTESSTFIINSGDVLVYSDFTLASNVFAAFIIRDGDLLIEKDVTTMQGMYLVEQGEVKSAPEGDVSDVQLKVSGNLYGNLGHLLAYRRYIGDGTDIKPSIEINFDLRLLDNTPPMLEQFLGDGWREDVQG